MCGTCLVTTEGCGAVIVGAIMVFAQSGRGTRAQNVLARRWRQQAGSHGQQVTVWASAFAGQARGEACRSLTRLACWVPRNTCRGNTAGHFSAAMSLITRVWNCRIFGDVSLGDKSDSHSSSTNGASLSDRAARNTRDRRVAGTEAVPRTRAKPLPTFPAALISPRLAPACLRR